MLCLQKLYQHKCISEKNKTTFSLIIYFDKNSPMSWAFKTAKSPLYLFKYHMWLSFKVTVF